VADPRAQLIRPAGDGRAALVCIHAQPRAKRRGLVGLHGGALKLAVLAPAESGRANEELALLLAEILGVPGRAVELVGGAASRRKTFRVDLSPGELRARVERALLPLIG
jgi:uncharacterized protein (TIGR00251 family)